MTARKRRSTAKPVKADGLENSWILPINEDLKLRREEEEEKKDVDGSNYIYKRCGNVRKRP